MSAYATSVLAIMGINVMLAVSLNMITGFCGQFSLGHAAFYGAGAYGAAFFAAAGAPLPLALAAGIIVAGLLGLVVGFAALRLRADFLAVATIGVSLLCRLCARAAVARRGNGRRRIPARARHEGDTLLIIACALVTVVRASTSIAAGWALPFRAVRGARRPPAQSPFRCPVLAGGVTCALPSPGSQAGWLPPPVPFVPNSFASSSPSRSWRSS